jgi:hypothetical protein
MHRLQAHAQRVIDKLQETEMFNQELWQENEAKQQSVEALQQQLTILQHQSIEERNYYSQLLAELEQAGASQRVTHHTLQETLQHSIFDLQSQLAEQQELRAKEEEQTNKTILALQHTLQHEQQQRKQLQIAYANVAQLHQDAVQESNRRATKLESAQVRLHQFEPRLHQQNPLLRSLEQQLQDVLTVQEQPQQLPQYCDTQEAEFRRENQEMANAQTAASPLLPPETPAALRSWQTALALALQGTEGNRTPALLRAVWQRHSEILLAPFQGTSDVSQALVMCQTWLTDLQLCADFTAVQQDNSWEFSWQPLPAPFISSERHAVAPQISIIALLWALLNVKTTQQWLCCVIAESDTTHTRVVFSLPQ